MDQKNSFTGPACQHVRVNGERCTQPARRKSVFCRFHAAAAQPVHESRQLAEQLQVLEDHESIQLAISKVVRYLLERPMDAENARAILSGLRLASNHLARHRPFITIEPDSAQALCPEDLESPTPPLKH